MGSGSKIFPHKLMVITSSLDAIVIMGYGYFHQSALLSESRGKPVQSVWGLSDKTIMCLISSICLILPPY